MCAAIFEEVEKGIRECIVNEIFAWHDVDCSNDVTCTCAEIANQIAPETVGHRSDD
jgi:hypothetical protein